MIKREYDIAIIGGGPNGLICAAYLSMTGLRVGLFETRHETGGGLCTEEFAGFRFNLHATYHLMAEIMPPYRDFSLNNYGVRFIYPEVQAAYLNENKKTIIFYRDKEKTSKILSSFSPGDGERYSKMYDDFKNMSEKILIPLTYVEPLPPVEQFQALHNSKDDAGKRLAELSELTPLEVLEEYGFTDSVKAKILNLYTMWGISPFEPLGYLFPLYVYRMTNAALCAGGSHRLSSALHRVILRSGGEIHDRAEVVRVIMTNKKVDGVLLADGSEVKAKAVVSTVDPHQSFLRFFNEKEIPVELSSSAKKWEWEKGTFLGIHLGLKEAPRYIDSSVSGDANNALICFLGITDTSSLLEHIRTIEDGKLPDAPQGHVTCPSVFDPLQAPEGFHTGRWESLVPFNCDWDNIKEEYAQKCMSIWKKYAPNIESVHTYIYPPTYIEKKLKDMVRGSFKQGAYIPLQMGYFRPNESCSQVRTPINGYYLCGACVYPGGMIIGGPGYIGANVIAEDMGIKKWWRVPDYIRRYIETYLV